MREYLDAGKRETVLVGPIERMLLEGGDEDEPRRQDALHVSELAKSSFCPRAAYQRITGATQPTDSAKMRLQAIFEEGHDVHAKWQRWVRRLGRLYGRWLCVACEQSWMGTSPEACPNCSAPGWKILYKEVPINAYNEYMLVGHGDGQVDDANGMWIEAKTIGIGTVRMEAPSLLARYTNKGVHLEDVDRLLEWVTGQYRDEFISDGKFAAEVDDIPKSLLSRWVDFDGLWKNIRKPFPSHLRQGHLYGALAGVSEVIFIYEYKPNQAYKEFVVKTSPSVYEPLLEMALDVKWAVEQGRIPRCPHRDCKECTEQESDDKNPRAGRGDTARGRASSPSQRRGRATRGSSEAAQDDRHHVGGRAGDDPRTGRGREDGDGPRRTARRTVTRTPRGPNGAGRQSVDDAVHEVRGLGRLLRDGARSR